MKLSKRAKRGLAAFNHIQTSPNRLKYMMRRLELNTSLFSANVMQAAIAAGETLNAKLPAVPDKENVAVQAAPEVGAEQSLSGQPQGNTPSQENTSGGPK